MRTFPALKLAVTLMLVASVAVAALATQDKISEKEVRRYVQRAEKEYKEGKLKEAIGYYFTVLYAFPEMTDVRFKVARIHKELGELANAATAYEEALPGLEKDEEIAEAYEVMTIGYARTANYAKAVEYGRKAWEMNPQSADVAIGLAMGLAKTGSLTEAAEIAKQALVLAPDSALAHNTLGEAALAEGNVDEAKASFTKALELDANTAEAHAGLAEIHFQGEEYAAAADSATRALELNDQLTRAYGIRGKANNALGKSNEAQADLSMAITVSPDDPDANLAYAQVHHSLGNNGQAATYYLKTISLNPSLAVVYEPLAEILVAQQRYNDLMEAMQQVTATNPDIADAHLYLAVGLDGSKQTAEALAEFNKAIELDESLGEAHYHRGKILRAQKQTADAIAALQKAESLDSENAEYLTELGIAYYEGGQLQPAMTALEKAINSPDYANALGWVYYGVTLKDSQRYADAAGYFTKAVEVFPNYGLAHWGLAWSAFGQIKPGCPCTPQDDALVALVVDHSAKAVEFGANDPGLTERADVLGRGEKVK